MVPDCENGYFTPDNVGGSDAFLQKSSVLSSGGDSFKTVSTKYLSFMVNNCLESAITCEFTLLRPD